MSVPITALYAGVYALLLLVLAARVSGFRMKLKVGLGDGGHPEMARSIRAHGNSVEGKSGTDHVFRHNRRHLAASSTPENVVCPYLDSQAKRFRTASRPQ
jgi:hypothetical protein